MKTILCFCAVMTAVVAFPQAPNTKYLETLPVVQRTEIRDTSGQISESYSTHDGQSVQERGVLTPTADGKDYVLAKTGSYQFTAPDGRTFSTNWQADVNGFRAQGAHIPVAPAPAF